MLNDALAARWLMLVALLTAFIFPPTCSGEDLQTRFGSEAVRQAGGEEQTRERLDRTPLEVAEQLSQSYGQHLDVVMYQPALALMARLRLADLTSDQRYRDDVERVVTPWVLGQKPTLGTPPNGSQLAGHLVFAALADVTLHPRYIALTQVAADQALHEDGTLREAMPFHNEMSDAVFMGCPILTAAGRLTGDQRYLDMALRHFKFMQALCLREDGLYRHSPLCEAAWGRGNGFPALGLALSLTDLDALLHTDPLLQLSGETVRHASTANGEVAPIREELLQAFRDHMQALCAHQDESGMWHQVIDVPRSYPELTATCMITFALIRGMREGWIDDGTYRPVVEKAWEGIKVRIGSDGSLFQVCTGTGKQKSLQDYLDRPAITGRDERGGAMALMCAVEMAAWLQERQDQQERPQTR